jgi:CGNR zinc finger
MGTRTIRTSKHAHKLDFIGDRMAIDFVNTVRVVGGGTPEEYLLPVAEAVAELLAECNFDLVRQCASERCVLWFYDQTKGHGRRYCNPLRAIVPNCAIRDLPPPVIVADECVKAVAGHRGVTVEGLETFQIDAVAMPRHMGDL